ncbi:thiamine ABC transporter ATP-binding protein [Phyllobacterium myrsinacearum]|uniref:Thiamine transport system ATP-binding protein n=1 Tax=Phyllobacterium myrsinacearum TaxID=28101 RepID=A0A839EDY7_9HYPH|nr:thiamine ABC transporter ATP-binding protein [Phyllobacterium myrsinacearum]MBA8878151.1 thiamine transport system ATP-binding protein [Phyllobacterium myrsinacearum]
MIERPAHKTTGGAAIRLDAVRFDYGDMAMRFDLAIEPSSIATIIGPSGAGKSTVLNLIAGFESPLSGRILIDNEDMTNVDPSRRPVSMVFQDNNLFAHLDVAANVGLGRKPGLRLDEADQSAIHDAIVKVGLAGKEKRKPQALSGGERQRVAIARALVRNRPVLLLDEAFASLGPALRQEMLDLIGQLQGDTGMTIVMVTHHPEEALRLPSILFFLENGHVAASGPARDLLSDRGPSLLRKYLGSQELSL